jgi:uncharacterized protein (TIGR02444 family)
LAEGLWEWATMAYARPGAAEACLTLQDRHGQNVCLLLWAAWADRLDRAELAAGAALARDWEARIVRPLRATRRALKAEAAAIDPMARERLREQVAAAELAAERALLDGLQALAGRPGPAKPVLPRLGAAARAWGGSAPAAALADLAAALE